jgi:hypothetical protein
MLLSDYQDAHENASVNANANEVADVNENEQD